MKYIQNKHDGLNEEGEHTEQPTEEAPEYPQEQSSGGAAGWIIALVLLAAAGGGGYYWYLQKQRQREAAQRMAQKRVAQQNKTMAQREGTRPARPVSTAQNGARVRTGNYTENAGSAKPKATPTRPSGGQSTGQPYGNSPKNPYGRYTSSDTEEEASYTASFKPNAGNSGMRRTTRNTDDQKPET